MTTAHVRGTSSITVSPDEADVWFRAHATSASVFGADALFAERWEFLTTFLDESALEGHQEPPRSWDFAGQDGVRQFYRAGRIKVSFFDFETLAVVVNAAVNTPGIEVDHIHWKISTLRDLTRQARVTAIADAREVAEDYAAALDKRIWKVETVSDTALSGSGYFGGALAASAPRSAGTASSIKVDLNPEPIEVSGSVDVVYRLSDVAP